MRADLILNESLIMLEVIVVMRDARVQLALIAGPDGPLVGFVALEDLLALAIGEFHQND